jgi:hypothetical protein
MILSDIFTGVRIGRYSTAVRTNVIIEVKKLQSSTDTVEHPSLTPKVKDTGCPADTKSLTNTTESLNIPQNSVAMDIPQDFLLIEDPVLFADDRCLEMETSSDGSRGSLDNKPETSSSSPSSPSVISPSSEQYLSSIVDFLETCQIPSPDKPQNQWLDRDEPQTQWLDREESNQVVNTLMTGYHCLQPFTKSLTDEELDDIFTHGVVSRDTRK